jgi:hypothetical protein
MLIVFRILLQKIKAVIFCLFLLIMSITDIFSFIQFLSSELAFLIVNI